MLKSMFRSINIGLSQKELVLLQVDGWRRPHGTLLTIHGLQAPSAGHLALQLRAALTKSPCKGLPARVILADEWVRLFVVTPPQNTTRMADCRAAAAMRFHTLYGAAPADWQIEGDWDAQRPFLACAIPQSLGNALQQISIEHGLKLISIKPHFVTQWNRWRNQLKTGAWIGVAHGAALTIGMITQGRLCAVRTIALIPDPWHDMAWLPSQLNREALRLDLPAPEHIQVCGAIPGAWSTHTLGTLTCERLDSPKHSADSTSISAGAALAWAGVPT